MRDVLRQVRDPRTREEGMTLTEMLVSMIVFAIAMVMVASAAILVMRTTDEARQSAATVTELRQAVAVIDRQVRSGNVLFSPANEPGFVASCQAVGSNAGTCMRIFTQSNGDEKCVQWQVVDDGTGAGLAILRMRSWEVDWQTGGVVSAWSTVARDLRLTSSAPPFTLLGAATPYKERALQLHVVAVDERSGKDVAVDSTLTGRNTSYGYDSGQCTPVPPA
ncbi:PulJ/GspJ family protein [Cellulomonas fimi]|uniref:Prepilin-type cleavage/methylation-like protein n=1 Tax=Cellulomonas fimi (strain ATCC 484 / DSM 20113 / JCM 1341 / CCUG 24087 / LMG 16345 / NBRC 15513 / NCIMB 8980 / NCTC 7547 / NRS-133) TaxID=590998 RepID=F4H082_CELFA|nr:type II secretion system protein [Cellulomonas fimi]AEE46129.1 prepilin-type cleavage/methylation-like protein [Cellulomonas fimi ATCC 484]NNH08425.1 type II secretion system protein [Cellulomonas fimi]VEH31746.1 Type II secretory pathway, component PulJ [Cellulomonas fimi]